MVFCEKTGVQWHTGTRTSLALFVLLPLSALLRTGIPRPGVDRNRRLVCTQVTELYDSDATRQIPLDQTVAPCNGLE